MPIKDFKVEKWLNPRDAKCRYNLGASCVKSISLDELLELVRRAQQVCVNAGANRVMSVIKIDYKPDGVSIDEKIGKYRS